MKKILLLCLLAILVCVPTYAAEVDDAKQIVSDLKEISYRYESGLSYVKFNELYGDVYVKVRKFEDAYPDSELVALSKMAIEPYGDAKILWGLMLPRNDKFDKMIAAEKCRPELEKRYPDMDKQVEKIGVRWDGDSTLRLLLSYASYRTKELQDKIAAR